MSIYRRLRGRRQELGVEFATVPVEQSEPSDVGRFWLVGPAESGPMCARKNTTQTRVGFSLSAVPAEIVDKILARVKR